MYLMHRVTSFNAYIPHPFPPACQFVDHVHATGRRAEREDHETSDERRSGFAGKLLGDDELHGGVCEFTGKEVGVHRTKIQSPLRYEGNW